MPRALTLRLMALLAGVSLLVPSPAAHAGAWSTWIRMVTTNDMIALRDTVWLASGEAGILRYLRSSDRFEQVTREPGGPASNAVTTLTFDRSGRLWAGTAGKGVSRLSASGTTWDLLNAFDGLPSDSVTVLRADGDTVWIGTTRGIALWDGQQVAGAVPDIGTPSPFRSNLVTGIVVIGDTLFVATNDGLWEARLSQNLSTWAETDSGIPVADIAGLASDGSRPFALTTDGVIYGRNTTNSTWFPFGIGGHVDKLRDDFGTLLAVSPNGLYRWSGTQWNTVGGAWGSGSGSTFSEFGADPDGILFNTHAQSLYLQSGGAWVSRKPPGILYNSIHNVLHDGTRLWLASDAGISRYDGTTWRNFAGGCCGAGQDTSYVNPAFGFTLQADNSGRIWSSHWEQAMERADPRTNPMHVDHAFIAMGPVSDPNTRHSDGWSSTVDPWGYVFIGGDTPSRTVYEPMGIDVYDTTATRVANWKASTTGMAGNQVRALAVDKYRTLWAGFAGAGVAWTSLDAVDSDTSAAGNDHLKLPLFHPVLSLNGADIFGVVVHGDSVWVLTTSDLQRLRASTHGLTSTYEIPAGPAPTGAVHPLDVAPDGTVWVGSVEGVRRYTPGGGSVDYRTDNSPLADNEVRSLYVERATGAVWIATASGLNRFDPNYQAPAPPTLPHLDLRIWPNPATGSAVGVPLHMSANSPLLTGEIIDITGRLVRRFAGVASGAAFWNGLDSGGSPVRPGVYFVHTFGGGREATARVVVLR